MNRESSMSRSAQSGSYVQLSTFDDKENTFVPPKSALPQVWPYKRCLCTKRDIILVAVVLIGAFIIIAVSLSLGLPKIAENRKHYLNTSFPVSPSLLQSFSQAVVIADAEQCAVIGKELLQSGGSAVDAAIATLFCNGVVHPQSMGLGGGFFMTIYTKEGNIATVIDAREVAPENASQDMYGGDATLAVEGGLSIGVPGELRGYKMAYEKYGKLPWETLIMPSVKLCNEGFEVSEHLAGKLEKLRDRILADNSMRSEFFNNATNDLYKAGEILTRPVLGNTLSKIATEGADAIYTGSLHELFLEDIKKCGGLLTAADLANYKSLSKPSTKVQLVGDEKLTLHSVPPPGSGLILSLILNTLAYYNMTEKDFQDTDSAVLMYHRIIEAFKFGFAHRTQLADEAFVNLTKIISELQSKDYAKTIWGKISDDTTYPSSYYNPVMQTSNDQGTAHVSVLAANGDAVSVTSSVNTYFGSLCRSPSTGIILNNVMDDFSSPNITNYFKVPPSPANCIAPGKRPLSSACPAIITDSSGNVQMVVGGAGGTRIITNSAMGIIRTLWLSQTIKQATDAPRIHHQLFPNYIEYEKSFPKIYLDKLENFGHTSELESQLSIFMGIVREAGQIWTNVDFRKAGSADGF